MADPGIDSIAVLQERTFGYFTREVNADTGLVSDSTRPESPASIAASGFACACYAVAAHHGILPGGQGGADGGDGLRVLWEAEEGGSADGTGSHGFFYH